VRVCVRAAVLNIEASKSKPSGKFTSELPPREFEFAFSNIKVDNRGLMRKKQSQIWR
jgi:hypothetical protein